MLISWAFYANFTQILHGFYWHVIRTHLFFCTQKPLLSLLGKLICLSRIPASNFIKFFFIWLQICVTFHVRMALSVQCVVQYCVQDWAALRLIPLYECNILHKQVTTDCLSSIGYLCNYFGPHLLHCGTGLTAICIVKTPNIVPEMLNWTLQPYISVAFSRYKCVSINIFVFFQNKIAESKYRYFFRKLT